MKLQTGVNTVIQNAAGRIALIKREDFEVWCLPGGLIDPDESLAEAARREAVEETGLTVKLTRLVGTYSLLIGWTGGHIACFTAECLSGELRMQPEEAIDIGWFDPHDLPEPLMWWHRQRIEDAINGVCGAVWTQTAETPAAVQNLSRPELYARRDASGLSRVEFYHQYVAGKNIQQRREV